jgi:hypothetical protein
MASEDEPDTVKLKQQQLLLEYIQADLQKAQQSAFSSIPDRIGRWLVPPRAKGFEGTVLRVRCAAAMDVTLRLMLVTFRRNSVGGRPTLVSSVCSCAGKVRARQTLCLCRMRGWLIDLHSRIIDARYLAERGAATHLRRFLGFRSNGFVVQALFTTQASRPRPLVLSKPDQEALAAMRQVRHRPRAKRQSASKKVKAAGTAPESTRSTVESASSPSSSAATRPIPSMPSMAFVEKTSNKPPLVPAPPAPEATNDAKRWAAEGGANGSKLRASSFFAAGLPPATIRSWNHVSARFRCGGRDGRDNDHSVRSVSVSLATRADNG